MLDECKLDFRIGWVERADQGTKRGSRHRARLRGGGDFLIGENKIKTEHWCQQWDDDRCKMGPSRLCVGCDCLDCKKTCAECKNQAEKLGG